MVSGKTIDELPESEIKYLCTLDWDDVKKYLTKIHGRQCWEGFTKRVRDNMTYAKMKYGVDYRNDRELT